MKETWIVEVNPNRWIQHEKGSWPAVISVQKNATHYPDEYAAGADLASLRKRYFETRTFTEHEQGWTVHADVFPEAKILQVPESDPAVMRRALEMMAENLAPHEPCEFEGTMDELPGQFVNHYLDKAREEMGL